MHTQLVPIIKELCLVIHPCGWPNNITCKLAILSSTCRYLHFMPQVSFFWWSKAMGCWKSIASEVRMRNLPCTQEFREVFVWRRDFLWRLFHADAISPFFLEKWCRHQSKSTNISPGYHLMALFVVCALQTVRRRVSSTCQTKCQFCAHLRFHICGNKTSSQTPLSFFTFSMHRSVSEQLITHGRSTFKPHEIVCFYCTVQYFAIDHICVKAWALMPQIAIVVYNRPLALDEKRTMLSCSWKSFSRPSARNLIHTSWEEG